MANTIIITGNLTADPEIFQSASGNGVCKFAIANETHYGKTKNTTFVGVTTFGKTAENIHKFFKKGQPILINGRLAMEEWNDKTTNKKRTRLHVIADTFEFFGGKRDDSAASSNKPSRNGASYSAPASGGATSQTSSGGGIPEDEIPF